MPQIGNTHCVQETTFRRNTKGVIQVTITQVVCLALRLKLHHFTQIRHVANQKKYKHLFIESRFTPDISKWNPTDTWPAKYSRKIMNEWQDNNRVPTAYDKNHFFPLIPLNLAPVNSMFSFNSMFFQCDSFRHINLFLIFKTLLTTIHVDICLQIGLT